MNTIWFPAPVVLFFRRLFNVAWTLSAISRQYPSQIQTLSTSEKNEGNYEASLEKRIPLWDAFAIVAWPGWLERGGLWKLALSGGSGDSDPTLDQRSKPTPHDDKDQSTSSPPHPEPEIRNDVIHQLMSNPVLYDPLRAPRYPIVLCHGTSPPFLEYHSLLLELTRDSVRFVWI